MTSTDQARPNIVMVICDQLRADHLGFGGNEDVRTPHLDQLAEDAVVFDQAYVANPTCMPNRASILTGRWPSAHGTRTNGIPLDPDHRTFVQQLADEGYRTCAVGKLHHQNMGWAFEDDQREQIEEITPLLLDTEASDARTPARAPGWDQWENHARHEDKFVPLPKDYYGYDHVDLVIGHGDAPGGHWKWWAAEKGVDARALGGSEHALKRRSDWEQVFTSAIPASAHPTEYIGERAEERIRAAAENEDPYFMFVSFPDPHHPFAPPKEYADRYNPESFDLPRGFNQDHGASPAHIRAMVQQRGTPPKDPTMAFSVDEEQYRQALAAQYGLIEFMDEQVGRVLAALEETGQAENTIILFTADHGDLFGDHGLMLKHFIHYEAVTRVPLLMHVPELEGSTGRRQALVSSVDISSTLLDLTGSPEFRGMQGWSVRSVLEGADFHREAVLVEEEQPFSPEGLPAPVRIRTVVTPEGRLTRYFGSGETEVYDHLRDPDELVNVAGTAEARELEARLTVALVEQMAAVDEDGIAPTAAA